MTRDEVIELIRKRRVNLGLTKSDAARLAGMPPSQWHKGEDLNSKQRPTSPTLLRMAAALGLMLKFDEFVLVREKPVSIAKLRRLIGKQGMRREKWPYPPAE